MRGWTTKKQPRVKGYRKTEYNGIIYHSALEAKVARDLDMLRNATKPEERIATVERQYPFMLRVDPVLYLADFFVTYADGHQEVIEVKGYMTGEAKRKLKLFKKQNPKLPLRIVTK